MVQDVGVVASGFFQGVGKDGEAVAFQFARRQDSIFVGGLGKVSHG